jgi:ribosomal protein S18 acetylase RimI-like enzyme
MSERELFLKDSTWEELLNILSRYDATFYAYGSRAKGRHHAFSDVDLFACGNVNLTLLRSELEESDLPIKVDLQPLERMSSDFFQLIRPDISCIQASSLFTKVEKNSYRHFAYLPRLMGFSVMEEKGTTLIQAGLGSSMFNIACGGELSGAQEIEGHIQSICNHFGNQPFAWWLGGSTRPNDLGKRLINQGFIRETTEYAMIRSLSDMDLSPTLEVWPVETHRELQEFIALLEIYDPSVRPFYERLDPLLSEKERLFVGYEGKLPVSTALLYIDEGVAGLFSLTTKEDCRGRGYGTAMIRSLMGYAKQAGAKEISLSASSDSGYSLYRKLEFETVGIFDCCELAQR